MVATTDDADGSIETASRGGIRSVGARGAQQGGAPLAANYTGVEPALPMSLSLIIMITHVYET